MFVTMLARSDGRGWSVLLELCVNSKPTATKPAKPARGVEKPYRVRAFSTESADPVFFGTFASERAARMAYAESVRIAKASAQPSVAPVCPRCLGVEPGTPGGDPDKPYAGPLAASLCPACAAATRPTKPR